MALLAVSVVMSISSVVGMVMIGAANEAAECVNVKKKSKDVVNNYSSVVESLKLYMNDINSNSEQISKYLGQLSDEMEELRKEYTDSVKKKNETFINIQIFGVVLILIIMVYLILRYLSSNKIVK